MIIDGLQCEYFSRDVFETLRRGDVGCVTATSGFWEGPVETMDKIGRYRDLVRENADIVGLATTAEEVRAVTTSGRLALILASQNTELYGGRIRFVELFADMGVRVVQLTYNNQNAVGGSCYEPHDSGLARFGRELVREINRCGVLIDLSHVGNRTSLDAIEASEKPVAITHANAQSVFAHARNKPDDVLRALAAKGGVMGCAAYRNITGDYFCSSVDAWCELVKRTVDLMGIDHVGIGTDFSHNFTLADYEWMRKGHWTRGPDYGAGGADKPVIVPKADWLRPLEGIGAVPAALARAGFTAEEVEKITSGNWLRVYREVFGA
jgi:membrane dipeptidase